jgi:hypothetical protein
MLAVGTGVLLLTILTMPGALSDYLRRLPQNLHAIQVEQTYLWDRHVTLKGFWRLLLQGRDAGETSVLVNLLMVICAVPLVAGLFVAAIRSGGKVQPYPWGAGHGERHGQRCASPTPPRTDGVIAATIASAPLLMPFYFDYDLVLLAGAAVLVTGTSRTMLAFFAALYLWLFVNPYVAGPTRLNLTVPLLFGVALALTDRALHGRPAGKTFETADDAPPVLARAA